MHYHLEEPSDCPTLRAFAVGDVGHAWMQLLRPVSVLPYISEGISPELLRLHVQLYLQLLDS